MIKANELRIGNWLSFGGINQRVGAIDLDLDDESEELVSSIEKYTLVRLRDGVVSPIPITPEILEKCGFEIVAKEFYKKNDLYFRNYEMNLFLGGTHYILDDFQEIATGGCKYVHQLQNLYFDLTEQELEVKL